MTDMRDGIQWYEFLIAATVCPASFFWSVWLIGWLTNSDPLIEEIWRRERLEQLEGERRRDADTLRKVIGK
jgi:hypothetical protein